MSAITVLTGPERRRRWPAAEKLRIVEETLAPGAKVVEVARRHDVHPNLLHLWRAQARRGELGGSSGCGLPSGGRPRFAPIVVAPGSDVSGPARAPDDAGSLVEVMLRNGRVMRVPERAALARVARLADVLEGQVR
jgi:transposase